MTEQLRVGGGHPAPADGCDRRVQMLRLSGPARSTHLFSQRRTGGAAESIAAIRCGAALRPRRQGAGAPRMAAAVVDNGAAVVQQGLQADHKSTVSCSCIRIVFMLCVLLDADLVSSNGKGIERARAHGAGRSGCRLLV